MDTPNRPKMLVLGLDGLPLSLATKLSSALPDLATLGLDGRTPGAEAIEAELPELSPVNWTSFYTAMGPEDHGVFGFTRIDPSTMRLSLADFSQVSAPTIFDRLGAHGMNSRVLNLPNTYPARKIPGMLVSGFVAHDLEKAVHPRFLASHLAAAGYRLEADTVRGAKDFELLLDELETTLEGRLAALDMLWPDQAWDLFVMVLTETDRLFHFMFDAVEDPNHVWHSACMDLLKKWDRAIGKILERYHDLPGPKRLMVLADHGFTGLLTEVCLNTWLMKNGFMALARSPGHELDAAIAPGSRAFALDPGRIYIYSSDRFPMGRVAPADKERVKAEISEGVAALTWEGRRVMNRVEDGTALYRGKYSFAAPDLVCVPEPGFDLKAKFDRKSVFGHFGRTGTHTVGDAFYHSDAGPIPERLRDTGRQVLDYFGIPLPGRVDEETRLIIT